MARRKLFNCRFLRTFSSPSIRKKTARLLVPHCWPPLHGRDKPISMRPPWLVLILAVTAGLTGCSESAHQGDAVPTPKMVSAPEFHRSANAARISVADDPANTAPAAPPFWSAKPIDPVASDAPANDEPESDEPESDEPESDEADVEDPEPLSGPIPNVAVRNIGMHIGGGPNDSTTKGPIRAAVRPHYDDFRRCYGKIDKPAREITFGVDIRIHRKGGFAKISNPRSGFKGRRASTCMLEVFEGIEFTRPPSGKPTNVSFSLGFNKL